MAYCERVRTGASVAAQLVCPDMYADMVVKLVAEESCKVLAVPHESDRTSLWIYRDELATRLIQALQSSPAPTELEVWSMGKLFGYGNQDILSFIERSKSICPEESSQLPS